MPFKMRGEKGFFPPDSGSKFDTQHTDNSLGIISVFHVLTQELSADGKVDPFIYQSKSVHKSGIVCSANIIDNVFSTYRGIFNEHLKVSIFAYGQEHARVKCLVSVPVAVVRKVLNTHLGISINAYDMFTPAYISAGRKSKARSPVLNAVHSCFLVSRGRDPGYDHGYGGNGRGIRGYFLKIPLKRHLDVPCPCFRSRRGGLFRKGASSYGELSSFSGPDRDENCIFRKGIVWSFAVFRKRSDPHLDDAGIKRKWRGGSEKARKAGRVHRPIYEIKFLGKCSCGKYSRQSYNEEQINKRSSHFHIVVLDQGNRVSVLLRELRAMSYELSLICRHSRLDLYF